MLVVGCFRLFLVLVSTFLQTKTDNQEQYSRRPCLVINELEEPGDEDEIQKIAATIKEETCISRNTVIKNLDKTYPIDQVDDAGKQKRIVKFTSDSFKETVYKNQEEKQKKLTAEQKRKKQQIHVRIKFQPSLTKLHVKLLGLANERFREVDQVKFAYADIHGNINVMLRSPVQRKYVLRIQSEK